MAIGGTKLAAHALFVAIALASCAQPRPRVKLGPPPALPDPRGIAPAVALEDGYWVPVEAGIHVASQAVDLPVPEADLVRVEGATRLWEELGAEGRERLRRDGVVVVASAGVPQVHMGAFYMNARTQRLPYVVTLDALAYAVHLAFERALAEVDEAVLAPELDSLLTKLELRLSAEQQGAGVEMAAGLSLARGLVAVARGLASESSGGAAAAAAALPPELGPVVIQEIARVVGHAGTAQSPLLGAPIDYARFVAPTKAGRPGSFRAMAWLGSAPLLLAAKTEVPGAAVGVGTARLHARAAMLLARVSERDFDPAIHAAWSRIARLLRFVWGPPDDLAPSEVAGLAAVIGTRLEDPKGIADVVTVDRLRRRAMRGRQPLAFDGAGAPGRAGIGMRLFGGHAPADSVALGALVDGARRLPMILDLAVWVGAPEARASLHEAAGDGSAAYEAALARAIAARPAYEAPSRHASVQGSLLDVVMTWLGPREGAPRAVGSPAAQRASIESALAAWTFARHADQPLSRPRPARAAAPAPKELRVSGAALPAFVEAAPDVIARLIATVGQMKRGLAALGNLPPGSLAMVSLAEVEDILRVAMRIASHEADDEPLATEDLTALASLPARFARLEEQAEDGGAMVPLVAEIMVDAAGEQVLSSATGGIERAVTVVREPGTGRLLLAVGAHVAHHELVEPRAQRSTDATHRQRLREVVRHRGGPPNPPKAAGLTRGAYTAAFRMAASESVRIAPQADPR